MRERLEGLAARVFTRRYLLALGLTAALSLVAQAAIQVHLRGQRHDAAVINLAGRQRMLSQELAKSALAWRVATDPAVAAARLDECRRALADWSAAHERLARGADQPGTGLDNSPGVAAAMADLDPIVARMRSAAASLPADPDAVDRLMADELGFLRRMEAIVGMYQREAAGRVGTTMRLELALCAVLLAALAVEAALVFRPAVRWLRAAIADQDRLREQEALNRELTVAAEVARRIGYDLHDGVGQALTALSLQARAAEAGLPPEAREQVRRLRLGLGEALAQTRAAARCLVPVDPRVTGAEEALAGLAEATASATGIACTASCETPTTPEQVEDLYRIAQEAVTNALRHGRARTIAIRLVADGDDAILSVSDDGQGDGAGDVGLGMRSMRHRAGRLGGSLSAGPVSGGGWRVECRFPRRARVGAA